MGVLVTILEWFNTKMTKPEMYGWFHLVWFALSIAAGIFLCIRFKEGTEKQARGVILTVAILVTVLEIYKQIVYSVEYQNGVFVVDYPWYIFPWQFCSMPMYVGLLAGFTPKGKVHDAACAFLSSYAIFAGLCVMLYPVSVFTSTVGVNIQTMVCHGSMLTVGIYLLYTGYVKSEHKTFLKALPVFGAAIAVAIVMNEIAFRTGLLETDFFNMFYISPHAEPHLPVYSSVQAVVPFPFCLFIYIAAFSLAAYLILLIPIAIKAISKRHARVAVAKA